MSNKVTSIDKLNELLFMTIEGLQNNKDPQASECEKIDPETGNAIANVSKVIIDGYKVKVQALNMYQKTMNPTALREASIESGIISSAKELPEHKWND